jgi:NADH:ubiquinone oxidoreductase subunit
LRRQTKAHAESDFFLVERRHPGCALRYRPARGLRGQDEQGNKYYEEKRPSIEGRKRRYVIYNGLAEASRVSPDWHGWMHHTIADPPTIAPLKRQSWEKPHVPNLTGTVKAYRPKGSLARGGVRQTSTADYEAWTPDSEKSS